MGQHFDALAILLRQANFRLYKDVLCCKGGQVLSGGWMLNQMVSDFCERVESERECEKSNFPLTRLRVVAINFHQFEFHLAFLFTYRVTSLARPLGRVYAKRYQ